jgi:transcriptional regulator with XRE-family HTH domain
MAKRVRKPRLEKYEAMRQASGWYLGAWRDYRELSMEELAAEVGTSKGMVSDLESGALDSKGAVAQRFNRDWVEKFAVALNTTGGFLIDVNPFGERADMAEVTDGYRRLDKEGQEAVLALVERLSKRALG